MPDSALLCYKLAIKQYDELYGRESVKAADCYLGMGNAYETFYYDYNRAEALYERALAIREKIPPGEVANFMVGVLHANLVEVNRKQKDFDKALFYELKNIGFAETVMKYVPHREGAYEGMAITYADLGQLTKARGYYQKAIGVNKEINKGKDNANLASHYKSLAELDEREKSIEAAKKNYQKSALLFQSSINEKDPKYIVVLQRLGQLFSNTDREKSMAYFRTALSLINCYRLTKSGQATELNRVIGDYFSSQNQTDSAFVYYQRALWACSKDFSSRVIEMNPRKTDIYLKDYAFEVLLNKAQLLSRQYAVSNQLTYAKSALKCYQLAEELLSESRADLDTDRSRWNFFDSNFGLYEQAISLLEKLNRYNSSDTLVALAFQYMESSKSKTLSDALNQAEFVSPLIDNDSLIQSLNAQKGKLHFLHDQLKQIDTASLTNRAKTEVIGNSMIEADRLIQRIEQQLNERYPSYLRTKYQSQIPSVSGMQDYVHKRNASIIEYFWGEDQVFAIGIVNNNITLKRIGSVDSVAHLLKPILDYLRLNQNNFSQKIVNKFARNSYELYSILLKPFSQQLQVADHLIIIPDGLIGQLPFEILNANSSESTWINYSSLNYMVKTHFISYSFSSGYLLRNQTDRLKDPRLLAFGFTEGKNYRSHADDGNFAEIVGSEKEIEALSKTFPDGEFFLGPDVTEERFKQMAPLFDILHLAVHGQGDTEQNYSASLYFRDSLEVGKEDGKLNWYELFDIRLKAQLAVISSCESGIGKTYRGEGMLSMANAFAYAGCRNVVMGLWKVNDQVSVYLMDSFYKKIREGDNVDDALTLAKRSYLEQGDEFTSNPKMWASLVTYGNQEVIKRNSLTKWYYFLGVFIVILIPSVYFFRARSKYW
jgi:CHAT domain-containing protein/tetratricopeptide (TPR) repeat protein